MVTTTRMAAMTMPTTAPLSSGSGSLHGIASQLSLPSISTSCPALRGRPGPTAARLSGARQRQVDDALEQLRLDRPIGSRRHGLARLCQFGVAGVVEGGSRAAHLLEPSSEIGGRHRLDDESHPGKALAAEICGKAG